MSDLWQLSEKRKQDNKTLSLVNNTLLFAKSVQAKLAKESLIYDALAMDNLKGTRQVLERLNAILDIIGEGKSLSLISKNYEEVKICQNLLYEYINRDELKTALEVGIKALKDLLSGKWVDTSRTLAVLYHIKNILISEVKTDEDSFKLFLP